MPCASSSTNRAGRSWVKPGHDGRDCVAFVRGHGSPITRHAPRMRGIQYAAASRFNHGCLWNTGSPVFTGDDGGICGARQDFAISPQVCARFDPEFLALSYQRAQGMPGARCARSRACSVESRRVCHHGHTGNTRHSPRNGFNSLCSRSPRGPGSFAPSFADRSATLAPASGRQDHTTSPSASGAFVSRAISVHRIPPHVRDDRETPL
jgi:hypothetical protein